MFLSSSSKWCLEDTYFEKYYENIKQMTFPSLMFPLSEQTAKELHEAHEQWKKEGDKYSWNNNKILLELAAQIQQKKEELNCDVFVRLSSRSPKDAPLTTQHFLKMFESEKKKVEQMEKEIQEETSETNRRLHALYRSATFAMRNSSSSAAV